MAINFSAQFIVNEKTSTRVLRLTDTSTGFTLSKGNFLVTFPDGTQVANTDFAYPEISAPGGYTSISLITDIDNTVLTGTYVITYVALDTSLNEYNKSETFDFNWEKPTKAIINDSDVVLPEVQFKDLTAYETSGSFTGTLTRNFYTTTPSTSEVGVITKTSVGDILMPSHLTKYYEGIYLVKSDISVAYTHTSKSWLTVAYTDLLQETYDVREAPTQDELVVLMNNYKDQIEAYKTNNPSQYEILNEQYDLVLALYSHIIARYQTATLDGSKSILDQLLGLLPPTEPYTYKATQMLGFVINFSTALTGSGTAGYLSKFTDTRTLANSIVLESAGKIGIGKTPTTTLDVNGTIQGTSIVKSGGVSTQFLKADGTVDSSTYLTTSAAASTYQPLDGDLTAIAVLAGNAGILTKTAANTWILDTTSYQVLDADLTAIAALSGTTGILTKTAANTWTLDTTSYQVLDADLTAIAALTGTTGILIKTAANTWALDTATYQLADADLTAIAALTGTTGLLKKTAANTWTLDTSVYLTGITSSQVTTALGFTPENAANKGVNNGYAGLDSTGKVPSTQLPSYVDDVLEYANLAAMPGTGETGKIYVALDTNKIYRWSGSVYTEVSPTVGTIWGGITGTLANQTDLQNALNAKQATITLTTTGTSGAATLVGSTLNIPIYQGGVTSFNTRTGAITLTSSDVTTALTFTPYNATNPSAYIALTALSSTATGLTYTNTTGVFSLTTGYAIPTTIKQSNWDDAYTWVAAFPTQTGNTGKFLTTNGSALSWASVVSGVSSFNTRTGAVTLSSTDVNTALGYTAANAATYVPYTGATSNVNLGNNNLTVNNIFDGFSVVTASGTQIVLTVTSVPSYLVNGSGGQTIKLPDATTLPNGTVYIFNNNQSSGAITVNNNSNTLIVSIPSGGYAQVELIDNSTAAGSWDRHFQAPSNVSWSTNTFDYAGSITSATWNGVAVAVNRGGTGASTAAGALTNLGAVPTTRTLTINGTAYDLSADRSWTITSMIYPSAGIAVSTGTAWGTSITDNSTNWNTAYTNRITSLTTNNSSGSATLTSNTLNIPTYTLAGLGGVPTTRTLTINGTALDLSADRSWTISVGSSARNEETFTATAGTNTLTVTGGYTVGLVDVYVNGVKYAPADFTATTSPTVIITGLVVNDVIDIITYNSTVGNIAGSGTVNYVPKFTASGTVGNSIIYDNSTNIGIGTTAPTAKLEVNGYGTANSIMTYVAAKFYGSGSGGVNIGTNGTVAMIATDSSGADMQLITRVSGVFYPRITIGSAGNVGIGMTPYVNGLSSALDMVGGAGMFGFNNNTYISTNSYFTDAWRYKASDFANVIGMEDGNFTFAVGASGTTGAAISFSTKLTITSGGDIQTNGNPVYAHSGAFSMGGTYQTIFTAVSGGVYLVSVVTNAADGTFGLLTVINDPDKSLGMIYGNNISLQFSGDNVQMKSTNGSAYTVSWTATRLK